jgi:hypothetical protein
LKTVFRSSTVFLSVQIEPRRVYWAREWPVRACTYMVVRTGHVVKILASGHTELYDIYHRRYPLTDAGLDMQNTRTQPGSLSATWSRSWIGARGPPMIYILGIISPPSTTQFAGPRYMPWAM